MELLITTKVQQVGQFHFKITNDIALAVDQLGTRKSAIAVYLEPWHMDIVDFIDLKKNSGEERRRAHDLFPCFMDNRSIYGESFRRILIGLYLILMK